MTTLILILSGILIGAGVSIIWRDVQRGRRGAFVLQRGIRPEEEAEVEITVAHRARTVPEPVRSAVRTAPPTANLDQLRQAVGGIAIDGEADGERPRLPVLEAQWSALQLDLEEGVTRVNAVLQPLHLSVGASGEPTWSYKNKGFGAYRRLLIGEESVAWLRVELSSDGELYANVKAHKDERAELNGVAHAPSAGLDAKRIGDLLSECLKPAVSVAAGLEPTPENEEAASGRAWKGVEAVITASLRATNGALAQAAARLVPLAPVAWQTDSRRHRLTLSVEVGGSDVARMHIERLAQEIEVSVGVRDARLIDLGRRRRISVDGLTTHALAELIAGCAWPSIARVRENRPPA
jgi:hypothetical protein